MSIMTADNRRKDDAISANECQAMRHLRAAGWSRGELIMVFESNDESLSRHIDEHCDHPDVLEPKRADPPTRDELLRYRCAKDFTQTEAADHLGVGLTTWVHWEKERKEPHPDHARLLREEFAATDMPATLPEEWSGRGRVAKYTKDRVLEALAYADRVADDELTVNRYRDIRREYDDMPSTTAVYTHFDSWDVALSEARSVVNDE